MRGEGVEERGIREDAEEGEGRGRGACAGRGGEGALHLML